MHDMVTTSSQKEEKGSGKITSINVKVLDDGTYYYSVYTDKGKGYDYSFQTMDDLKKALDDDLESPHLRKKGNMTNEDVVKKEMNGKKNKSY